MRTFLSRTVLFCILVVLVDMVFAGIMRRFRPVDYKQFLESRQTFFKSSGKYDILVFGDSHIADAVDCRTLELNIGKTAYNLGVYHAGPYEVYNVLRAAIRHQDVPPKMVILGTNPSMFYRRLVAGKYTPLIVPGMLDKTRLYWHADEAIGAEFFFKSVKEKYLVQSMKRVVTRVPYKPTREVKEVYNGYLASVNQIPGTKWDDFSIPGKRQVHYGQVEYFGNSIRAAKASGARVLIVNSPLWWTRLEAERQGESLKTFTRLVDSIAHAENVEVINADYNMLRDELRQEDFLNNEHLNWFGAVKFTQAIAGYLKNTGEEQAATAKHD